MFSVSHVFMHHSLYMLTVIPCLLRVWHLITIWMCAVLSHLCLTNCIIMWPFLSSITHLLIFLSLVSSSAYMSLAYSLFVSCTLIFCSYAFLSPPTPTPHPKHTHTEVEREVSIMWNFRHPNVVTVYGLVETDRHIDIVMELAKGSLYSLLTSKKYEEVKWPQKLAIMRGIANGLEYSHQKNFMHLDIKRWADIAN